MGVTYVVVAPESELCGLLMTADRKADVEAYIEDTRKVSDIDRMSTRARQDRRLHRQLCRHIR